MGEDYGNAAQHYANPRYALSGASGRTLAAMAGLSLPRFLASTLRLNVVDRPEDWRDRDRVRAGVERVAANFGHRHVVLLGSKVSNAMGRGDLKLFEWVEVGATRLIRLPHPSGRNYLLNDPDLRAAMASVVREVVRG